MGEAPVAHRRSGLLTEYLPLPGTDLLPVVETDLSGQAIRIEGYTEC